VQTALESPGADLDDEVWSLWSALVEQHGQ
jgi:hypothetical protein